MVDITKKSNRKCEHCKDWGDKSYCGLTDQPKNYRDCCKKFEWHPKYLADDWMVFNAIWQKLKELM